MNRRDLLAIVIALAAATISAVLCSAAELSVGPGDQFMRIEDALAKADPAFVDIAAPLPPELLKLVAVSNTLGQYKATRSLDPRPTAGKAPDLGAYEFAPAGK